jgi:fatty acid desaturase
MAMTQSEWYQTLSSEKKREIHRLGVLNPHWNLIQILFVLVWIGLGWLIMNAPHWSIWVACYFLAGMVVHGIGNFMHEGIHGNLFRNKRWNRVLGFLSGVPTLLSVSAFGANHLLHHKHTRTEQDPDELLHVSKNRTVQSMVFYLWFLFGTLVFGLRIAKLVMTQCSNAERNAIFKENTLIALFLSVILLSAYFLGFFNVLLHCWIIPLAVASLMVNIRSWSEHQLTSTDHPLRQTRTITGCRFFSFFNINLNYHLEHHLFPGVPWYNLPALHQLLQPEYEKAGASIYRSYSWFLWDAVRYGIHGRTPDLQ